MIWKKIVAWLVEHPKVSDFVCETFSMVHLHMAVGTSHLIAITDASEDRGTVFGMEIDEWREMLARRVENRMKYLSYELYWTIIGTVSMIAWPITAIATGCYFSMACSFRSVTLFADAILATCIAIGMSSCVGVSARAKLRSWRNADKSKAEQQFTNIGKV